MQPVQRSEELLRTILRQPKTRELPSRSRREEVTIGGPDMRRGCYARAAAQNHLRRHELAVVLSQRAGKGFVAWIAGVAACGPLPDIAEDLLQAGERGRPVRVQVSGLKQIRRRRRQNARLLRQIGIGIGQKRRLRVDLFGNKPSWLAACSHSNSVGRRWPAQRAYASASKKLK